MRFAPKRCVACSVLVCALFRFLVRLAPFYAPIYRDPNGVTKLEALRSIIRVSESAPFEFAISNNSFNEVRAKGDARYLQRAYDVLDHWLACLENIEEPTGSSSLLTINSNAYD